jgi:hypothetical protein
VDRGRSAAVCFFVRALWEGVIFSVILRSYARNFAELRFGNLAGVRQKFSRGGKSVAEGRKGVAGLEMEGEGGEMDGVLAGGWGLFYNLTFSPLTGDKKKKMV